MADDSDRDGSPQPKPKHHKSSTSRNQQQQSVSAMVKQGFIPESPFSPSTLNSLLPIKKQILNSLPPPPSFQAPNSPGQSPTLSEMMASEQAREPNTPSEACKKLQERVSAVLWNAPFMISKQWGAGDVRLTLAARNGDGGAAGFKVSVNVHRKVLAARSRFFAEKLRGSGPHSVDILECDDVAVYLEAVVLMYYDELKNMLLGRDVSKILALLKISSAIMFDDGIWACLEHLESAPWSEEEQESVISHLNELHFDSSRTKAVLQRLIAEPSTSSRADDVFLKLSSGLLQTKDEKARRQMKSLIFQLLLADNGHNETRLDISRDTLYHLCDRCLSSLVLCLSAASGFDESKQDRGTVMAEVAREADNMQWIVAILIKRKIGDEFVKLWADQRELADLHSKIPAMYRHEISNITAQLCISIGRGQVLVPKETRFSLLSTWLEALYDDFSWMRMAGKSMDKRMIEDGLCRTILTLPLPQQQSILLDWFDRYLNRGDDCPNIQRALEIWWRRAFVKQYVVDPKMQITISDIHKDS